MRFDLRDRRWLVALRCLLLAVSLVLCLLCVLAGARPGWLEDCYIIRIEAFPSAATGMLGRIPGMDGVFEKLADGLMAEMGVPDAVSIFATGFCSESSAGPAARCAFRSASDFDIAAKARVVLAILYAAGMAFLVAGLLLPLAGLCMKRSPGPPGPSGNVWAGLALLSLALASLATSVLACAVYMVLSENLPSDVLAVRVGGRFLALTWSACTLLFSAVAVHALEAGDFAR